MKPVKVISLALVAVVVMALAAGVAYWSVGYDPNKVEPGLYLNGKERVDNPGTILTVDGQEVDFNLYRYVYMTTKYSYMSYYGEDYFDHDPDGSLGESLRDYADENIRSWFTWLALADEMGITLSEEELQQIEDDIASDKELYGAQFESRLADQYLVDEDLYREVIRIETLVAKASEEYSNMLEAENGDELLESIATAKHILITGDGFAEREEEYEALMAGGEAVVPTEPAGDATDEDEADADAADLDVDGDDADAEDAEAEDADAAEEQAEPDQADEEVDPGDTTEYYEARAKAFAEWLVEQIAASDDAAATFEEFRLLYDEDPGQEAEDYEGYTFAEGYMVEEFYQEALALEIGEISAAPVATDYGYHILLRLPLNLTEVEEGGMLDSSINEMISNKYYELYEAQQITYGTYYEEILPANVK